MKDAALFVAGIIFFVVGLMHVARLYFKVDVKVCELPVPLWTSIYGFVVAFILAFWMFTAVQ
jgi:hypothetical protein